MPGARHALRHITELLAFRVRQCFSMCQEPGSLKLPGSWSTSFPLRSSVSPLATSNAEEIGPHPVGEGWRQPG